MRPRYRAKCATERSAGLGEGHSTATSSQCRYLNMDAPCSRRNHPFFWWKVEVLPTVIITPGENDGS